MIRLATHKDLDAISSLTEDAKNYAERQQSAMG